MNPLTDELKQAFEHAAYSFNDWRHHGGSERLLQISDALQRCTPLSFSPELGGSIAGVPLILIFDERGLVRIRVGGSSAYIAPVPLPSSQIPPSAPVPLLLEPSTRQDPPIWMPGLASPTNAEAFQEAPPVVTRRPSDGRVCAGARMVPMAKSLGNQFQWFDRRSFLTMLLLR
jgi:hypothetical protein